MNSNANLQDRTAYLPSGDSTLTGTVSRTSDSSIWVRFEGIDGEIRFVRRHEGQWVRYGRLYDEYAAVLTFSDDEDAAASPVIRTEGYKPISSAELEELLAPAGWDVPPAPVAVTRIEFTEAQASVADRIQRVNALVKAWDEHEADARLKLSMSMLDSFRIDALITAAGRLEPLRNMRVFLGKMLDAAVIGERGRVLELLNPALAEELLGQLVEIAQDAYESWHRPNSTSNVDVEIKLATHEAWQSVYRVATGKRFY